MLDSKENLELTAELNKKINVPILNENFEGYFLSGAITAVDAVLEGELGFDISKYVADPSTGVTPEEKSRIVEFFAEKINKKVDVPVLSEGMEAMLFPLLLESFVDIAVAKFLKKNKEGSIDA